jgi:cytochrome c
MGSALSARDLRAGVFAAAVLFFLSACRYATTSPTTASSPQTPSASASGSTTLTYTTDVAPILASDCVRCHGPSIRQAGIDLSTYAGVLHVVSPGDANSLLVLATQPNGLMYGQFSGNRSAKSTTIRDWVVSSKAAQ